MTPKITKAQGRAFLKRWRLVNEREIEELRATSMEVKLQQFNTLLTWAHEMGWDEALREGEEEVRERWARLRRMHDGEES